MTLAQNIVVNNYTTMLLILLCGIKLLSQKKTRDVELRYFWVTLGSCFLLVVQDILESYAAADPDLRFWRILFSVIGYVLRPVAGIGLLLVILPPVHRTWKVWVPALINLAVNMTAFFSPVAFSFDEDYDFIRGPLGCVVFIVSFFYLITILVVIQHRFYEGNKAERLLLICCVLGVMGAVGVDTLLSGHHLVEAIMIGCIFIMFFLRTHDNYLDPLTLLRNRIAYYNDCESLQRNISAVASIDMNGLKKLNDSRGHAAGDAALVDIGKCLSEANDHRTLSYRVGGDEFVILFMDQHSEKVEQTLRQIRENISKAGYSVSVGYAMKLPGQTLEETLRQSDQNMYKAKAEFYQQSGTDRRSHPRDHAQ